MRSIGSSKGVWTVLFFAAALAVSGGFAFAVDPDNPPDELRGTVSRNGSIRTFNLQKYSCRGENFELVLMDVDGVTMTTLDPGPVRTYRGWCEEETDSYVEATLLSNGDLRYHVFKGNPTDWWYDPGFETNENAPAEGNFTEISGDALAPAGQPYPGASLTVAAADLNSYYKTAYQCYVGFDLLSEYVNAFNYTDLTKYGAKAENAIMHMNGISVRDMLAEHKLGKVVIRQSRNGMDYSNEQWGVNWPAINTIWNNIFPDVDHHFVSLVGAVGGGVAFVCDYSSDNWGARSFNGWSGDGNWWHVWRHEAGHNWGCGDCVEGCPGPDGSTVNSGNNIQLSRFSNPEIDQFMNCRSGRGVHLREIGPYDYPVPPYANLDELQMYVGTEANIDALSNDYDANNDLIAISDFDPTSANGGVIAFSAGAGLDGRDELIYTPPANSIEKDYFYYRIVDQTGRTSEGKVIITFDIANTLKGYWPLNETTGTLAQDQSIFKHNGAASGDLDFGIDSVGGRFASGVNLDGVDDHIAISDLDLYSENVTISGWVKLPSQPSGWSAILFNRNSQAAGLSFGTATELRYHWNNNYYNWRSGLSLPLNKWVFVALVVEPHKAAIYMYYDGMNTINNNNPRSAVNYGTHNLEAFKGTTYVGYDPSSSSRHLKASVDDVRIYNYAMTIAEIKSLIAGGRAESPNPFDGSVNITLKTDLSWAMGAAAVGNDIYIGTDRTAVQAADLDSPEYIGSQPENLYSQAFEPSTEYFWRIDQVDGSGNVTKGTVWSFTTSNGTGTITRQVWQNMSGAYVYDLKDHADYPDNPTFTDELSSFEAPTNWADNYATKIHGFLIPETTGIYTFWIASDDRSELWLSSGTDPANISRIAQVAGIKATWTEPRQWDKYASQQSASIKLFAGKPYYIMALHKEGKGDDNLAVAWQGPGIAQQVISGQYLMPYYDNIDWSPRFSADPIIAADAIEGISYNHTIAGIAQAFGGQEVTYSKLTGPDWLNVASDGTLSGLANDDDATGMSNFTIQAKDSNYNTSDAQLHIFVHNASTGELGFPDFGRFSANWLSSGCIDVPKCGGCDLNGDGDVDMADMVIFCEFWLKTGAAN